MAGLLCLALTLGLLPSGLVLPARAAHWADAYGQKLVEWGVMRGDISGNLNLDRAITRAELVTMINRAYGYTRKAGTPFTDVPSSRWYADDIDIAYNAGYFKGVSSTAASPESSVTREQAAVFLARNLMLQETVGETLGFSDTRTLSEWSRGLIGAAVKEGVLNGYTDGSFQPKRNITRGEMAAMLVRAIGTPVNEAGNHTLGHVYGNVTLNTSNVTLRDTTIAGNLYLTGGIDLGHVLLENVTVLGRIIVSGAGESISGQESVVLRNVEAEELVLDSLRSPFVTIKAQGVTDIPLVTVRTNAYVDDSSWEGYGLARIELRGAPGAKLQLAGSIKEVMNFTPASDLQFVKGSAEKVTVDEDATASKVLVDKNTRVDELNLDVATTVSGTGDIGKLNVGSAGSVVEQLPDQIVIRPGIDADIDGETIGSADAAELSAEPRLLAGYPFMKNIAPTEADGVFSASKPGTIYWAISAVADGSVSEEDLIENPAYGGNIFQEQAGTINAGSAKTEYVSKVQELEPDGTYYVSAILVDGRGKHSPLKVMSFATPDDTKPAFVKDPTMTKISTDVAQTTVMANKDCLLYWALLPTGAQAPTPQEFKTGSLGGNYGYGSLNVVKNAEISVTVNRQKLREKTTYDLFLWLTDHNGAQSMDAPFKLTFTTPDETPPVVTDPQQIPPYAADSATVSFSMNEVGTLYWAVVPDSDNTFISIPDNATKDKIVEIMSDLRNKIRVESASDTTGGGSGATAAGKADAKTAFADVRFQITKLLTETTGTNNYRMWYIGKDAAGNYADMVGYIDIKTLDTTPPSVEQKFTDEVEGKPRASTDIRLEFSETVKGGREAGGPTFLSLYDAVRLAADDTSKNAAKDNLARELAAHIQLYSVPRAGQRELLEPLGGFEGDKEDTRKDWVIDFHNARVEQESDGKMVIILPSDKDPAKSALQLNGGATYYFQLLGVYDNAFVPNGILNPETKLPAPSGNLQLEPFTTIYAQITLSESEESSAVVGNDTVRLDMCLNMDPDTIGNVAETERWDMILWSDTSVEFEVYRRVLQGTNVEEDWTCINKNGAGASARITVPATRDSSGISLRANVIENSNQATFDPLSQLDEKRTYQYGIHFTKVGNLTEEQYESWSSMVTMRFNVLAGGANGLSTVANNVNTNYNKMGDYNVSSIGTASEGMTDTLTLRRQFTDRTVPNFTTGSPAITAGSSVIHMELGLDRNGTIFYVVAPASGEGALITTVGKGADTVRIDATNDGSNGVPTSGFTYIPEDGEDREKHYDRVAYPTIENPDGNGGYSAPSDLDIVSPGGDPDKSGSVEFTGRTVGVDVSGLMPSTDTKIQWYYIYFVLQGGGEVYSTVQCYRVKMEKLSTPSIKATGTGASVTMTPSGDNNEVSFALVEYTNLPGFIRDDQIKGTSVLELMSNAAPGSVTGPSGFDVEADEALKKRVAEYILGTGSGLGTIVAGRWQLPDGQSYKDYIKGPVSWSFTEKEMTAPRSEYVLLCVARHRYGGTSGEDYGFGAARSLYKPDTVPPEFQGEGRGAGYLSAAVKPDGVQQDDQKWKSHPEDYTYSGTVNITFSKDIYYLDNGVRNEIYYDSSPSGARQKSLASLLGGSAMTQRTASVGRRMTGKVGGEFTLTLNGISMNQTIVIFTSGMVCNESSRPMEYRVRLTFDPTLTSYHFGDAVSEQGGMARPGFKVTIEKMT